jgi:glutaredoxin
MLLKIAREGLGRIVVFIDRITRPTPMQRSAEAQQAVDIALQDTALYQYFACPFCIKTRRAIHRLNLPIALLDAQNQPQHREALAQGGGKIQVPCLRIGADGDSRWLYESGDIIRYLEQRFGPDAAPPSGLEDDLQDDADKASAEPQQGGREGAAATMRRHQTSALVLLGMLLAAADCPADADHAAGQGQLEVYECTRDGITTFSDQPCGEQEQHIVGDYWRPSTADAAAAEQRLDQERVEAGSIAARMQLKRKIARSEGRISDLQKQRDAEIAALHSRLNEARNNEIDPHMRPPASAAGPASEAIADVLANDNLVAQMKVIEDRYATDIELEQQTLQLLLQRESAISQTPAVPTR